MQTLRDVLQRLTEERLNLSQGTLGQLDVAVGWFEKTHGRVPLRNLTPQHITAVMRKLRDGGRSPRTCNNNRKNLLTLWRHAEELGAPVPPPPLPRKVVRMVEPDPMPRAWNPDQLRRLLDACRTAPVMRGWGPEHWVTLVLTIYDTSLRVGCLMRSTVDQIDRDSCTLAVPAKLQKGRRETCQKLHPDTMARLLALERTDNRLFPWPYRPEELWRKYRSLVLKVAGLPSTRRDQFHRIRRTSYTMVAVAFGKDAAAEHAAHRGDLSRFYLDPTFLPKPNPLDALPRIA